MLMHLFATKVPPKLPPLSIIFEKIPELPLFILVCIISKNIVGFIRLVGERVYAHISNIVAAEYRKIIVLSS